jgi:hypothetical protein
MPTLIKNSGDTTPECGTPAFVANDRSTEQLNAVTLAGIRTQIMDLDAVITESTNSKINKIKKATSFPIADVFLILAKSPDCKYLRVYNGFKNGEYVTYLAPVNEDFETYIDIDEFTDSSIITQSCCHCKPCPPDRILNP